jgi:hypothetical protein
MEITDRERERTKYLWLYLDSAFHLVASLSPVKEPQLNTDQEAVTAPESF